MQQQMGYAALPAADPSCIRATARGVTVKATQHPLDRPPAHRHHLKELQHSQSLPMPVSTGHQEVNDSQKDARRRSRQTKLPMTNEEKQVNTKATAPATTNPMNNKLHEEVKKAVLDDAKALAKRLGLRAPLEESPVRTAQMARAVPELAGKITKWPDLILRSDDGHENIHFIAVMIPVRPSPEDVRNVQLAASLLSQTTSRPAHAVVVEITEETEPDEESWNPIHWHTITRKRLDEENGQPQGTV